MSARTPIFVVCLSDDMGRSDWLVGVYASLDAVAIAFPGEWRREPGDDPVWIGPKHEGGDFQFSVCEYDLGHSYLGTPEEIAEARRSSAPFRFYGAYDPANALARCGKEAGYNPDGEQPPFEPIDPICDRPAGHDNEHEGVVHWGGGYDRRTVIEMPAPARLITAGPPDGQ